MSFMFNPTDYRDPKAVNMIESTGLAMEQAVFGGIPVAKHIVREGAKVIGIDGYATAPYEMVKNLIGQACNANGITVEFFSTDQLWREENELNEDIRRECMPDGLDKDPTQLYGKLYSGDYESLMNKESLAALVEAINIAKGQEKYILVVYGAGALCSTIAPLCDRKVWLDVTPLRAILNVKEGKYLNIGSKHPISFKQTARRCYFVDFNLALLNRLRLITENAIDDYVFASDTKDLKLLPMQLVYDIFSRGLEYPFRCKPVYLEGVWGGYMIKGIRNLPESMRNCAWCFDLIPMEVSIEYNIDNSLFEFPFYTLVQYAGEHLMGKESVEHFGRYFPIRFNYDDTFHSSGNMSIQCHPIRSYIRRENGEFDRQDESYYIVQTAQGARTYLGFNEGVTKEEFFNEIKTSEHDHTPIDYNKYVHSVESKPGMQLMIPSGTIHASGRNQLILEIGSLTVGSYTYKMYDYVRLDLDGIPRPLHTYHAEQVIQMDRTAKKVDKELIQSPQTIRKGSDWEEYIVGQHALLYFSLRNVRMKTRYVDDTNGRFHVLVLVDGENIMIRSIDHPERYFEQKYLDMVVVPADFGRYEVINKKEGTTVVLHKTLLKDGFADDNGQL